MSKVLALMEVNGRSFWVTIEQERAIDMLKNTPRGGIGTVHGYKPSTGWVESPEVNIQGIFRFSTERLYKRKLEALSGITFDDVKGGIANDPKLSALDESAQRALFTERLDREIASLQKTLDGDRNDSHREAHDTFYITVTEGVRVHLASTKADSDGLKQLVLIDGNPVADSIMVNYLEIGRTYVTPGVRKVVNSGAAVRMSDLIESQLNERSVGFRALSLKPENFKSLAIGGTVFESDELKSDGKRYKLIESVI